jgi:hypothetical protein
MNGHQKKLSLRAALFRKQRGRCHWCGEQMTLTEPVRGQPDDPDMCTLEHIEDRWSPLRGRGGYRNVAAHKRCNNARSARRERAILNNTGVKT